MDSNVKAEIFNKINKIDNPVLLSELTLFLAEWEDNETHNIELNKSIEQALLESKAELGKSHEQIWEQLKSV